MEKKGLGVNKNQVHKRNSMSKPKVMMMMMKKKRRRSLIIVKEIIDYLQSDLYFYSPVLSSSAGHISSSGLEREKPLLKNEGDLRTKTVEYLKSDTYLYAPLVEGQSYPHFDVKTVISSSKGQEQQVKKLNTEVPWKATPMDKGQAPEDYSSQAKQVAEDSEGEKQKDHHISKGTLFRDTIVMTQSTPEQLEARRKVIRRSYYTILSTISAITE